jgi:hypothetical protein
LVHGPKKWRYFIQHIHEPFVEDKAVYKGLHHYLLYLFEYLQERLLRHTNIVVLSSHEAIRLFKVRYPQFKEGCTNTFNI